MKQPMLGGDGWDSPKLIEIGKDELQGSYFSNHYSPDSKDPRVSEIREPITRSAITARRPMPWPRWATMRR